MVFTNRICVCISFHKKKACGKHVLEPEHDQLSNAAFSPVSHMDVLTVARKLATVEPSADQEQLLSHTWQVTRLYHSNNGR
jgi:hypothetical protein